MFNTNHNPADVIIDHASWDSSKVRDKLRRDIDAHVATVRTAKLSELTTIYEVTVICVLIVSCSLAMTVNWRWPNFIHVGTVNGHLCNISADERKMKLV